MLLADELDMAGEGYSYFAIGGGFNSPGWWIDTNSPPDGKDEIARLAGQGHFIMSGHPGRGPKTDEFFDKYSEFIDTPRASLNNYAGHVYDGTYVVSRAITKIIQGEGQWRVRPIKQSEKILQDEELKWTVGVDNEKVPQAPQLNDDTLVLEVNRGELLQKMLETSFVGAAGLMQFDSAGDRLPAFNLLNFRVSFISFHLFINKQTCFWKRR